MHPPKLRTIMLIFVASALLLGCSGKTATPAGSPTSGNSLVGTFVSGEYTLVFRADGTFTSTGPQGQQEAGYSISGNQMQITGMGCGEQAGTYLWHNDGQILTVKTIDDPCVERSSILSTTMWYAKP